VKYPDLPFAMKPIPRREELLVPKPLENLSVMTTLILMMTKDS